MLYRTILLTLMILALLFSASAQTVELFAANVGKADALLLRSDEAAVLIDTGYADSCGRILGGMKTLGIEALDAVIITHTDSDHVGGLEWLAASDIEVGAWYTSAFYTGKPDKHPVYLAAEQRGMEVHALKAGDTIPFGSETLNVLAPFEFSDIENDDSLVLRLDCAAGSLLLCGDMEFPEEEQLMTSGAELSCDVLKVPNHADDDTCSEAFIWAARPKVAVISTSTAEKPETPYPLTVDELESVGAEVLVTQDASAGILVTLTDGNIETRRVNAPEPTMKTVIVEADASRDIITLRNEGTEAEDLSGCSIASDRGNEGYLIPAGTILGAGETLTIGSQSAAKKETFDLLWDIKKVIHKKKTDTLTLYDPYGTAVSRCDNGL